MVQDNGFIDDYGWCNCVIPRLVAATVFPDHVYFRNQHVVTLQSKSVDAGINKREVPSGDYSRLTG